MKNLLLTISFAFLSQILLQAQMIVEKKNADRGYNLYTIRNSVVPGDVTTDIQFNGWLTPFGYVTGAAINTVVSALPVGNYLPLDIIFMTQGKNRLKISTDGSISINSDDTPAQLTVTRYLDQSPPNNTVFLARGGTSHNVKTFRLFTDAGDVLNAVLEGNMKVSNGSILISQVIPGSLLFKATGGAKSFTIESNQSGDLLANLQGNLMLSAFGSLSILNGNATIGQGNLHLGNGQIEMTQGDLLVRNGKVVIGDVNPQGDYTLFAERGILTEKVKVALKSTLDWSDFVFDFNYPLPSLTEVETYIGENKHLPGVPSANDLVKEGIDLAKMDAILLKKIEELTLYVIDLKKENEELKQQMSKVSTNRN